MAFDRGADRFINRGRSGAWREYMKPEDVARFEAVVRRRASASMAGWLEQGRAGTGEPRHAPH
jgi:hypothetical protein